MGTDRVTRGRAGPLAIGYGVKVGRSLSLGKGSSLARTGPP
jgi:hypothetical protein